MTMKFIKGAIFGIILGTIGGYLFNPIHGKKNRDKLKKVAQDLKIRIMTEMKGMKDVTKREYSAIIQKIIDDFKKDKTMSKEAWDEVANELKSRWKIISSDLKRKIKTLHKV